MYGDFRDNIYPLYTIPFHSDGLFYTFSQVKINKNVSVKLLIFPDP